MRSLGVLHIVLLFFSWTIEAQSDLYKITEGHIQFVSDAPLEWIEARSDKLLGLIDPETNRFAFSISMNSFMGFNSPLQREHFNENYIESQQFPNATFAGEIIEEIDYSKNGTHEVRAKGKLLVHGKERERIIKGQLRIQGKKIFVASSFGVLLEEHDIIIPRIVFQKIAEEIQIKVEAAFEKRRK